MKDKHVVHVLEQMNALQEKLHLDVKWDGVFRFLHGKEGGVIKPPHGSACRLQ